MKKSIYLLLLLMLTSASYAKKPYLEVNIHLNDGSIKSGVAQLFEFESEPFIIFKTNNDSEIEEIESSTIEKIIYTIEDEEHEFVFIKVYKGWKQVKIKGPVWLEVIEEGIATLYLTKTYVAASSTDGQGHRHVSQVGFSDYYIMRDGEPAAKLIATISTANNNQTFRAKAPLFFADYPELAAKIKKKEYTWRNLLEVVKLYNEWANK